MAFLDVRLPRRICETFKGGPTFANSLTRAKGGARAVNIDRPDPIFKYEATAILKDTELRLDLMAFFLVTYGTAYTFRFRDLQHYWTGCEPPGAGDITPLAVADIIAFGTGTGAQTAFQLYAPYEFLGHFFLRKVTKPAKYGAGDTAGDNPGYTGPRVYVNGTLTTAWTLDTTTGIITFTSAPANGHSLKWAGLFDVHAEWESDEQVVQMLDSPDAGSTSLVINEVLGA